LRHGWPLRIGEAPALLPVETAPASARSHFALISAARAATLKLANQREAADGHAPVLIRAAEPLDLASAQPIADPALDLAAPLKGPFAAEPLDWPGEAAAILLRAGRWVEVLQPADLRARVAELARAIADRYADDAV